MQSLGQHYSDKVEQGIALLEEKILRLGEHYGQLWFLVSGYGMLESAFTPHELSVHVQGMVNRLTKLFHKVISAQDVTLNAHTAAGALASLAGPTGNLLTVSTGVLLEEKCALTDDDRLLICRYRVWEVCRWKIFQCKVTISIGRNSTRFGHLLALD